MKALVSKTGIRFCRIEGSNPSLSADIELNEMLQESCYHFIKAHNSSNTKKTELFSKNYKQIMNIIIKHGKAMTLSENKNYMKMVWQMNR